MPPGESRAGMRMRKNSKIPKINQGHSTAAGGLILRLNWVEKPLLKRKVLSGKKIYKFRAISGVRFSKNAAPPSTEEFRLQATIR
jgi:hypothetical protein